MISRLTRKKLLDALDDHSMTSEQIYEFLLDRGIFVTQTELRFIMLRLAQEAEVVLDNRNKWRRFIVKTEAELDGRRTKIFGR